MNTMTTMWMTYLLWLVWYRVTEFLRHWYVKSARMYANFVLNQFEKLDYTFAWKITFHHLFQPLYGDYSVIGYTLGFIFRVLRLLVATALYAVVFVLATLGYCVWVFIPPYLLYRAFMG